MYSSLESRPSLLVSEYLCTLLNGTTIMFQLVLPGDFLRARKDAIVEVLFKLGILVVNSSHLVMIYCITSKLAIRLCF